MFSVESDGKEIYINHAQSSLNSEAAASRAKDKYLTRIILARHGLPNIPYSLPSNYKQAEEFLNFHKDIIVKPKRGMGATDITRVKHLVGLSSVQYPDYIFEKYIAGREMRYLILNGEVIAVHESKYGESVESDRDLERVSIAKARWKPELSEMALKIAKVMDLNFVAVDFLIDDTGKIYVLELNTSPGLKWFHAPSEGPAVDVATPLLQAMTD